MTGLVLTDESGAELSEDRVRKVLGPRGLSLQIIPVNFDPLLRPLGFFPIGREQADLVLLGEDNQRWFTRRVPYSSVVREAVALIDQIEATGAIPAE